MKRHLHIIFPIFLLTLLCGQFATAVAQDAHSGGRYEMVVTGTVRDKDSGRRLDNVTVSLDGSSIATVSNADGYFSLKFPRETEPKLNFSLLGYENISSTPKETGNGRYVANVYMRTALTELDEVIIFGNARKLVEEALRRVPDNYPKSTNLFSSFYRETVQKGHRYISVSEAIMDVYKTTYARRYVNGDAVNLTKARRLLSQKPSDTLIVKIAGGPNLSLTMDIVKNPDALFDEKELDNYAFVILPSEKIDDRSQYVVQFLPQVNLNYALFKGKVYIDKETLAFTRAEFSLDMSDPDKATSYILYKKPAGLRFLPQELSFLVTYRTQDGVTRFNYIRSEICFRCDWKKLKFSSTYATRTEMVVVEREDREDIAIDRKNAFRSSSVFYDIVQDYWDEDYWREYNIIEPTESLENAVKRLKRKL